MRRAILRQLTERPMPVGELARNLPVGRPAVSQHLKVLKIAGLVVDEAVGTRRIHRRDADGIRLLHAVLDSFWTTSLADLGGRPNNQPR